MKANTCLFPFCQLLRSTTITVVLAGAFAIQIAAGATVWNGPTITFTQPGTDATQATNQDRLTPNVWMTRGGFQGLFNAKLESFYIHYSSPADTEWAFGELTNYASLTYTNWEALFGGSLGGGPTSLIGKDSVVHLISENIYLSLNLTNWSKKGGTFSYIRSTPGALPAAPVLTGPTLSNNGTFELTFTNTPGYNFSVVSTTNLSLPLTNWDVLGQATYGPAGPGFYEFTDPGAGTNSPQRFYEVSWP